MIDYVISYRLGLGRPPHLSLELGICMGSMIMSGTNTQLILFPCRVKPDWWLSLYMGPFLHNSATVQQCSGVKLQLALKKDLE